MADVESRLREVLKKIAEEQEYQNCKIQLKPISSGGANYTSQLFAVTLSSEGRNDLRLFSKIAALGEEMRSMYSAFETEMLFYTKIIPKYRELEEKYNFPIEDRLVLAKFYGGTTEHMKEVLVLEELSAKGYQAFNRFKCFDWAYASKCITTLAMFHAFSVAFERDDPKSYKEVVDKLKLRMRPQEMEVFLNKSVASAVSCTDEIYRDRVEMFLRNDIKKQTYMEFFQPALTVVLSHGDFRPSNILHRIDEDGKLQVVLVDYQMVQRGNPVTDLLYFLINGSDEEFRANYLHQYFNSYYEVFSKTLHQLGINPDEVYSETVYRNDVKQILPFGLTLGTCTLPFVTVDEEKAPRPEAGMDADSFDLEISELFRTRFNGLVRDYVKLGIL